MAEVISSYSLPHNSFIPDGYFKGHRSSVVEVETRPSTPSTTSSRRSSRDINSFSPLQWTAYDFNAEIENIRLSFEVLNVLEKYGRHIDVRNPCVNGKLSSTSTWIGKAKFLPHVYHHVKQRTKVQLTMPAFPCKSLNRANKVLGPMPDLGDELALCHLDALACDIEKVYEPGAQVNIATDGVLFNDILGISDEETWDYGEGLIAIMRQKGLNNIKFTRPQIILGMLREDEMTKESYIVTSDLCRKELEARYGRSDESLTELIKGDKDTGLTYCGMLRFLETELLSSLGGQGRAGAGRKERQRMYRDVARKMMRRSEAFTLAIRTLRPLDVRLSIHPSSGAAKLSFPLIPSPTGDFQKSPWHSCVAMGIDGRYRSVHSDEVKQTHELVYRNGRPYYYRERSPLHQWEAFGFQFVPQYPHGTAIQAPSLDLKELISFASVHSSVSVKGFMNIPDGKVVTV